jgi:hypothetical protein
MKLHRRQSRAALATRGTCGLDWIVELLKKAKRKN